jgi:hypothetical protein
MNCWKTRITEEDGAPNGGGLSGEFQIGTVWGTPPGCFLKSEQVDWNVEVEDLQFLGVRKGLKMRGMRMCVKVG